MQESENAAEIGKRLEDTPTMRLAALNVVEHNEGANVELWMNGRGRVFIRAYNEGGYGCTDVDVLHLVAALRSGGFAT